MLWQITSSTSRPLPRESQPHDPAVGHAAGRSHREDRQFDARALHRDRCSLHRGAFEHGRLFLLRREHPHFSYRSAWYFEGESDDKDFFDWRAGQGITIGHDTWIGHGAVIMPGVTIGNGASIGANAVVTKDVADFAIAVGVPARTIRQRFSDDVASRIDALAWWDWEHEKLHSALQDFRSLPAEEFLERHGG
jgi:phosphonate metabolism protein (transferase hexapeptide repeat family)